MLDHIWRPMHSYNVWPSAGHEWGELCKLCQQRRGLWVEDPENAPIHPPNKKCPGLEGIAIVATGADLPRRSGKTLNGLSYPFGMIFLEPFERWAYIASAEDQAEELVAQNLAAKINQHPALKGLVHITANKVEVTRNQSWLEVLNKSHAATTGRGFTGIIYDEARDQKARTVAATMPSITAEHGYKCPRGHGRWTAKEDGSPVTVACPRCGARLKRWHARLLLMSASGLIEDNQEKDWFRDWIDNRIERPEPQTVVWRTDKTINPTVSESIRTAIRKSFGDVNGLKDFIGVELDNAPVRRGEVYVTAHELAKVVDPTWLGVRSGSTAAAVGFIDTSRTGDKTSLVICVDESKPGDVVFTKLSVAHIKVWNPKDPTSCPDGSISETVVQAHLELVLPMFTGLLRVAVDTRIMPWAKILVAQARRSTWGRKIEDTEGWTGAKNSAMYLELLQRIAASQGPEKTLRLFPHPELQTELLAMRKRDLPQGGIEVYDSNADQVGRNRSKGGIHRDVAMSVAACCLLAAEERMRHGGVRGALAALNSGGVRSGVLNNQKSKNIFKVGR